MDRSELPRGELIENDLTWREQEVLDLLAERLSNREIADRLHLAESTVKDYVGKIFSKLYVKNRREAVERARELGMLGKEGEIEKGSTVKLPAERTPFVGRVFELKEIQEQLEQTRLLTLIGAGGIGKTRLAVRAARELAEDFKDGVYFVSLAPISSVENIAQTIAESLDFPFTTHEKPQHQLLRYLQRRQMLLVMDNFEHLLGGTYLISEMLETAAGLKILATSREKLNMRSETVLNVVGMETPGGSGSVSLEDYDAVKLFVQSANKACPGFNPSQEELKGIASICKIVQGMPLGIELAAAWLAMLNVDEIAKELEQGFDILASEMRDVPERHRSLRAVFNHSWALLDPIEREIFIKLSVFRGGCTRDAALQVTTATLQQLTGLVNKSFLSRDPGTGRLEAHELLRQYGQEQLIKDPQNKASTQEAHAVYYADFMQRRFEVLKGSGQVQALKEIESDIENVRLAWRYYLDQKNTQQLWKFINCLFLVCWYRSWNLFATEIFGEAARILDGEQAGDAIALQALSAAFQAYYLTWLGYAEEGYKIAEKSVETLYRFDIPEAQVFALDSLGLNAFFLERYKKESEINKRMVEIAYISQDKWLISFALYAASLSMVVIEDYKEAQRLAEISLQLTEEIGDEFGSALPLITLGHIALAQKDYKAARSYYLRCLRTSQKIGFRYAAQTSSKYLGKVCISMGDLQAAENYLLQCLVSTKDMGFVRDLVNLIYEYARLQAACGNPAQAVELLVLVINHPASYESRLLEGRIRDSAQALLEQVKDQMGEGEFTRAEEKGQELDLEMVVDELIGGV